MPAYIPVFTSLHGEKEILRTYRTDSQTYPDRSSRNHFPDATVYVPHVYSQVYGGLINQVFPRVYSKDEFVQIEAKVLLILGEKEAIYNNLQVAIRSARELIPDVKLH